MRICCGRIIFFGFIITEICKREGQFDLYQYIYMAYGKTSKTPTANETKMAGNELAAMGKNTPKKRSKSPKATPKRGGSRKR